MSNLVIIDDITYKAQNLWRDKENKYDSTNKLFPIPKENNRIWGNAKEFVKKLEKIESLIENKKVENKIMYTKCKDCLLCTKKCVSNKQYILDDYLWEDGLIHYIKKHNIKPSDDFINFIFTLDIDEYFSIKLLGRVEIDNGVEYLKLEKNQLMILDALMKHGGYTKKYYDYQNKNITRYSEHAGFLEIKNKIVYEIIVSGNTLRIDNGDEEIFLPNKMPESVKYKYLFHTHPPTPKPGGRAEGGIIFEFPSIGDILHFIDHYNMGKTIGSLVVAPEGVYNIRKNVYDGKKIDIDEDLLYNEIRREIKSIHKKAITEYGVNFTYYDFMSRIAQDTKYIDMLNAKLEKYMIYIDFYPRVKDFKNNWIIDEIFIPIYDKQY
jgi:hypothetical protein